MTGHRILVVDDDAAIRELLVSALSSEGYAVVTAANGQAALRLVLDGAPRPDMILLDLRMPVLTGWEFARAYQATPGPHAPIVVMTATTDAAAFAGGIVTFGILPKPFDIVDLLSLVRQVIEYAERPAAS